MEVKALSKSKDEKFHQMRDKEHRTFELMRSNLTEKAAVLNELLHYRLKIWWTNEIERDSLCSLHERQNWGGLMKGMDGTKLHEVLICLIDAEFEKALFG